MKFWLAAIAILALAPLAAAQHQPAQHSQHGASPYAGFGQRPIKALSEQQTADLRAGRGMGLALAAELNGYPGPLHVLELGDALDLTDAQRRDIEAMKAQMTNEAVPVGEALIAQEAALDRAFADRAISAASLTALTDEIGRTQGRLRAVHLAYHLRVAAILSEAQKQRYVQLRGYL